MSKLEPWKDGSPVEERRMLSVQQALAKQAYLAGRYGPQVPSWLAFAWDSDLCTAEAWRVWKAYQPLKDVMNWAEIVHWYTVARALGVVMTDEHE